MAALLGNYRVCDHLLQRGAKVNVRGILDTPLICALMRRTMLVTSLHQLDHFISNPETSFSTSSYDELVSLLLRYGAKMPHEVRGQGWLLPLAAAALSVALCQQNFSPFLAFAQAGMDIDGALPAFNHFVEAWADGDDEPDAHLRTLTQKTHGCNI